MVRPRSALSIEKLTLDTPSLRAFEKTLARAGTTSDLAATCNFDLQLGWTVDTYCGRGVRD